jgi:hypothetical protein
MSDKTASLTVLGGPLAGTHCPLPEDGTVTIGSAPGSTLYLDLPAVSPYHARVVVEGGRISVHDTGSARTVHVNDNPLEREGTELRNGDILWLGVPGEEDVVMMQCILPRRTPTGPTKAVPPPLAPEPTPEIETVALWAKDPAAERAREAVEAAENAVAEGSHAHASASEAHLADDEAVVAEARAEFVSEAPALEPMSFVDEYAGAPVAEAVPEMEAPPVTAPDEGVVAESVAEVAPTLLMGSLDEVAAPVETPPVPDAGEFESYQSFVTEAEPEPVVEASPVFEPAPAPAPARPAPEPPAEPRPRPARPAAPRHAPPSASQRTRPSPVRAAAPEAAGPRDEFGPPAKRSGPPLLLIGGAAAVLVLAAGGYLAWRALGQRAPAPAARPTPAPVARASEPPRAPVATPEATAATPAPIEAATPAPTPVPTTTPATTAATTTAVTPTPRPTPTATPRATTAAATPPPAPAGPSPEQQRAQQVATLVSQAEAAIGSRQYDAALGELDNALKLEPGNAKATALRADAAQRRDMGRRRFVAGRTVVDSEKTRKDKASGGLVGFDADEKTPDFTGRIEFEMTPAGPIEPNDAWTLKVFVVNQGKKPIRVQGVTVGASVNGSGSPAPVATSVREIAPQQRAQVGETTGSWREGTTSWVAQATLTAPKNETLSNTLSWK